jgi:hypothetical protein
VLNLHPEPKFNCYGQLNKKYVNPVFSQSINGVSLSERGEYSIFWENNSCIADGIFNIDLIDFIAWLDKKDEELVINSFNFKLTGKNPCEKFLSYIMPYINCEIGEKIGSLRVSNSLLEKQGRERHKNPDYQILYSIDIFKTP